MELKLQTLLLEIRRVLASLPEGDEETLIILRECFGIRRHELLARSEDPLPADGVRRCRDILRRRLTGEPLAHILGHFYFYKHKFPVSPLTLIPRYDTEILVEAALNLRPRRILDVGAGTGVLALSLAAELPKAEVSALDIVPEPFAASAKALGIDRVNFYAMDFLKESGWGRLGNFDCIVSNPPYLSSADMEALDPSVRDWEPASALYGGGDGMAFYRALEKFCQGHLEDGGFCLMEVDHKFAEAAEIFSGYTCTVRKDYGGLERLLSAEKKPRS